MKKIGLILEFPTDSNFYMYCLLSRELLLHNIELNIYIPPKTMFFDKNLIDLYFKMLIDQLSLVMKLFLCAMDG